MGCGCFRSPPIEPKYSPPIEVEEETTVDRFYQIGISLKDPLTLISGYLDEPLLSLEETLQIFYDQIDDLPYYIYEAKNKCHYPSEHGLTHDESAAIYIYTMKWQKQCVYDQLQSAWSSANRSEMKPWFRYLKLFKSALDKLPNGKGEVWQGTAYNEILTEAITSKSSSLYTSMGSCSLSSEQIQDHVRKNDGRRTILIGYQSVDGKSITGYTATKQKEVFIFPGVKLGLLNVTKDNSSGSVILHLSRKIGK